MKYQLGSICEEKDQHGYRLRPVLILEAPERKACVVFDGSEERTVNRKCLGAVQYVIILSRTFDTRSGSTEQRVLVKWPRRRYRTKGAAELIISIKKPGNPEPISEREKYKCAFLAWTMRNLI